ncbi:MAG: hypothetical protein OER82_03485 [Nitrosopumilus sp.]|nr:hypothetical protein [Nitrosopumilus sp.]
MEIKNITLFFIGIIILILGVLVIIFDYPQIQFFENMDLESNYLMNEEKRIIYEKLITEFFIGIGISGVGILLILSSFLDRFENGFRQ